MVWGHDWWQYEISQAREEDLPVFSDEQIRQASMDICQGEGVLYHHMGKRMIEEAVAGTKEIDVELGDILEWCCGDGLGY